MLIWSLVFLVIALPMALLGLGERAGMATWLAEVFFAMSFLLFLLSLIFHHSQRDEEMVGKRPGQ
jgi:uncharacterized membrane protein YtjA (UPF0391 family)